MQNVMDMTPDKVREIYEDFAQEPVSLETPIGEEEDSHLGDFIEDEDSPAIQRTTQRPVRFFREQLDEVSSTP